MDLKPFLVYALPFPLSDLESEFTIYALNEADAREVFERLHPDMQIRRIKPC